jgi:hypothetical protein
MDRSSLVVDSTEFSLPPLLPLHPRSRASSTADATLDSSCYIATGKESRKDRENKSVSTSIRESTGTGTQYRNYCMFAFRLRTMALGGVTAFFGLDSNMFIILLKPLFLLRVPTRGGVSS